MKTQDLQPEAAPRRAAAEPEAQPSVAAPSALAQSTRLLAQRRTIDAAFGQAAQRAEAPANHTGLPDSLKAGIESMSGMDLSDVRVHRNSAEPAQLNALAYAQGNAIHLGPGQEQHLPHEAWHVVQQRQGRVAATTRVGNVPVNDSANLESEADRVGAMAARLPEEGATAPAQLKTPLTTTHATSVEQAVQRQVGLPEGSEIPDFADAKLNGILKRWQEDDQQRDFSSVDALRAAVTDAATRPELADPGGDEMRREAPQEFSLLEHYGHKMPQALDLATSARRQRMLVTSTLTRMILNARANAQLVEVPASEIRLLHPNELTDSKTLKRYELVRRALRNGRAAGDLLSADLIAELMPSDEDIQVAKIAADAYCSLQGVGRIVAAKEAGIAEGRSLRMQIKCFDLTSIPLLPAQLQAISMSYEQDESALSKSVGALVTTAMLGALVGAGYLLARWWKG